MKRTLSIEIFRPLENSDPPQKVGEKSIGFRNSGVFGLLRGILNMALWDLDRLQAIKSLKASLGQRPTKLPMQTSQVPVRDILGSLWSENESVTNIELWTVTGIQSRNVYPDFTDSTKDNCPWQRLAFTSPISHDTGSDAAFRTLERWVEHCVSSHVSCNQLSRSQKLPNRVVEYMGHQKIRLRETRNQSGRYICLSHCWGSIPIIRTLRRDYSRFCDSIPWDHLPLTFQHATEIAHRLGVDYVWIDSLCIIQVSLIIFPLGYSSLQYPGRSGRLVDRSSDDV